MLTTRAFELELPLSDGPISPLAHQRLEHVRGLGVSQGEMVRLVRAFPSLGAIYSASNADLARLVGPAAAARIRWFLDAPLDTRLAVEPPVETAEKPRLRLTTAA